MRKLAIITTHPIQYYVPVFQLLHEKAGLEIKVFYTWGKQAKEKFDPGFGRTIEWDLPLLDGYPYQWVENVAHDQGSHHFNGIVNPQLVPDILAFGADAVLVFGWAYSGHLKAMRYFKNKIPVFFRGDSTLLDTGNPIRSWIRGLFLRWVYRHVDHAFYVGRNNKAYFKRYGLREEQLSFAPHAVDNKRFGAQQAAEAAQIRMDLGISPGAVLVLFAGKFEPKKSPQLLLDAFLKLDVPDTHLLFVGNGPLEDLLKNAAGQNHKVHFMGFRNQSVMSAVYQACDLFCLPSQGPGETWGLAVNEAMACGKAVLLSDKVGCAADLLNPGVNGRLFKSGLIADLSDQLAALLRERELLQQYGICSLEMIRDWNFGETAKSIADRVCKSTNPFDRSSIHR